MVQGRNGCIITGLGDERGWLGSMSLAADLGSKFRWICVRCPGLEPLDLAEWLARCGPGYSMLNQIDVCPKCGAPGSLMSRLDPTVWAGEPEVSGVDGLLIDLPHRGNRLVIACRHCGHQAEISGRDICLRLTASLAAPVEERAAALSCGRCRSRWILVSCENDSAAQGFIHSTQDNGQMIWAGRLQTYRAEAGTSIEAFRSVLRDLPMRAEMAELLRDAG